MKNQGYWAVRLITLVFGLLMTVFMGYHIVNAFYDPLRTVTAVLLSPEDSITVTGLFVRDERLFPVPDGVVDYIAADGERVNAGTRVAVVYDDDSALVTGAELAKLYARREQLVYLSGRMPSLTDNSSLQSLMRESIISVRSVFDSGRTAAVRQSAAELRACLYRLEYIHTNSPDTQPLIDDIDAQIAQLEGRVFGISQEVFSPDTGYFYSSPDGYEQTLRPGATYNISPAELARLLSAKPVPPAGAAKLAQGFEYAFAFALPDAQARRLGSSAKLRFTDELSSLTLSLTVSNVAPPVDGVSVVTVTGNKYISRFLGMRRADADLILAEYHGLRVPREAVRVDEDGVTYVYCRVLNQVVRKNIRVIHDVERENYYLAEYNPRSTVNLLPGDEIITSGKDLYDKKVLG
jgi:hypothetical protein